MTHQSTPAQQTSQFAKSHDDKPQDHKLHDDNALHSFAVRSVALTGIFILMTVYFLYFAAEILIPITIAYCFNLLLSPLISKLSSYRIPPAISSAFVVISFVFLSIFALYSLSEPAEEWLERSPKIIHDMRIKLDPLLGPITGVQEAADSVDVLMSGKGKLAGVDRQITVAQPRTSRMEGVLDSASSAIGSIGIVVVLLYFLLAAGDSFLNKLVTAIPRYEDKRRAVEIVRDIQRDTSHYLVTRTLINIGLGGAVALSLYVLGMPNPILWGALAAVLNFAPYVGPATSLMIITIAAIISMDTLADAMLVPAVVLLLNIIEGEFISHQVIGKRLSLSPVVVFISIVFWGWLWGVAGALIAIPIIAAINVVCQHIEYLKPISDFISES